jgi:predicted PurR-regulated permease PerM
MLRPMTAEPHSPSPRRPRPDGGTVRLLIATVVAVAVALLAWQLADVLLLLFGAVLFATVLLAIAKPLVRRFGWPERVALAVAVLALLGVLVAIGWLIGDRIASQFEILRARLPDALKALTGWLDSHPAGLAILDAWEEAKSTGVPWGRIANVASRTLGALGSIALIVFVGIFLAADPALYRRGVVTLVPPDSRPAIDDALRASGSALTKWLLGQGVSMLFVGVATAVGLALLDVPGALSLGLIALVLDFVPFFGPLVSGALAVLFAFAQGPQQALYVAILALAIQQIEGNVLMPLIQRWAVALPPVLGIMAGVVFGLLFGIVGLIFATPLMVVAIVLVQKLYIERFLEGRAPR